MRQICGRCHLALEETLEREEATDEALTEIAKTVINQQAQAA